jgi:hypothetical protein
MDQPAGAKDRTAAATRTEASAGPDEDPSGPGELARLRRRVTDLQRERDHLDTTVGILKEVASSLHFVDILQTIARRLGDTLGLDRCAIFLTGGPEDVRLVASYEDPNIRNLVVDINRYPELKRAFATRESVFIPDVTTESTLDAVRAHLGLRNVRSILVIPLEWQGSVIGALFLRTDRDAPPLSHVDIDFCKTVATLTASSLRNAHRFEALLKEQKDQASSERAAEMERLAMLGFVRRLLEKHGEVHPLAEGTLPPDSGEELDRLVTVALRVFKEQAQD